MNDIREIWNQDSGNADLLEQILKERAFKKHGIPAPLEKLKRNLAINIGYAVVITLGYAALIFYFPLWQIQFCMLLLIVFNLWSILTSYRLYDSIDLHMHDRNVLDELKKHYHAFNAWKQQSLKAALLVYPFAAAGGFMLGGTVGSGKSVEAFMAAPHIVWVMLALIGVLVPLGYLLARWMTKVAFGKYVDQLKEKIDELEAEG